MFMTFISDEELEVLKELEEKYGVNLGNYIDPLREGKWTGYVDWLPVLVSYTAPAGAKPRRMLLKVGL